MKKKMVCYYGTWAVYRPGNGKFDVEDIDTNLCTHIIYGFTGLGTDNTIQCLDPWNDLYDGGGKGALYRFTGLKSKKPSMKALVAIG
jgi:chitinase